VEQTRSPALARAAGWLALLGIFAPASFPLWGAVVGGDGASFGGFLIAMVWTGSPVVGAAACVAASRTQSGGLFFLGVEMLLIVAPLGMILDSVYVHWSSMGGMIYLTWPLMAWPALLAVIALAYLFGWRPREGWPDPPSGAAR
jgi:hypothetical protein